MCDPRVSRYPIPCGTCTVPRHNTHLQDFYDRVGALEDVVYDLERFVEARSGEVNDILERSTYIKGVYEQFVEQRRQIERGGIHIPENLRVRLNQLDTDLKQTMRTPIPSLSPNTANVSTRRPPVVQPPVQTLQAASWSQRISAESIDMMITVAMITLTGLSVGSEIFVEDYIMSIESAIINYLDASPDEGGSLWNVVLAFVFYTEMSSTAFRHLVWMVFYTIGLEVGINYTMKGQSIGKRVVGLKIVTRSPAQPAPGLVQLLFRALLKQLTANLSPVFCLSLFTAVVTRLQRPLHDVLTGTQVVVVRAPPQ